MPIYPPPKVEINLSRIRQNCQEIARQTGVPVIAVVKADAYGLGAREIAGAITDLVDGFYVFHAREAIAANLKETGKLTIALLGDSDDPSDYSSQAVRPVVWTRERAALLKRAQPILSIDTGQQRFGCNRDDAILIIKAGDIREAMTHASTHDQAQRFFAILEQLPGGAKGYRKHAAGSALLSNTLARFDAVRPGLALYSGAVQVSSVLMDVRDSNGPAGYTGFMAPRFGLAAIGYSHGLRLGPCLINGEIQRVLEVGMQSSFVEIAAGDLPGDSVELLSASLPAETVAKAWNTTPQEVLLRLSGAGQRNYIR